MEAYHNSREKRFRTPFGALQAGQKTEIQIDIWNGDPESATFRLWNDRTGELRIPMRLVRRAGGYTAYSEFCPEEPDLFWYRFDIRDRNGEMYFYGPVSGKTGGTGRLYTDAAQCPSYQITVSRRRKVPEWYRKGIVYQIFPDRFSRSKDDTEKKLEARLEGHKKGPKRRIVPWNRPAAYEKKKDGSIAAWDFYGGSLKGVEEKLPYLEQLGISVIYLNPIFEAASNHRYDTGNYNRIDPLLGNEEDFVRLCAKAKEHGISVILDGVFNHTGCDSIYFNKYGNYPSVGAYQSEASEYRDWFSFNPEVPDGYDSWWGVGDLPNIREENESYRSFIFGGPESIVRKWMRLGAKGWRLDVADELPDDFIAEIKTAMLKEANDDALLMGEVWEDASRKEAYGVKRRYFQGDELDCVMNYPFRDGICKYLTGGCTAEDFAEVNYSLYENYPTEAFYAGLNLIGSHDRMRILSILGEAPAENTLTEKEKTVFRLDEESRKLAKARLWLAVLIQMTMPGVPCIYYGDEAGMEGYSDPYNRGAFPWGHEDEDCLNIYRNAIGIRRSHRIFTDGDFEPFALNEDVFAFKRTLENETVVVIINRNAGEKHRIRIRKYGEYCADLLSGREYTSAQGDDDSIELELDKTGSAVIYFSPRQRLGRLLESGTGVLCHITSLPNDGRQGVIGPQVFRFLNILKEHGEKYWQILPLNPVDPTGSPYAGTSAFAGNMNLLPYSMEELKRQHSVYLMRTGVVRSAGMCSEKGDEYERFLRKNSYWIDGYAMYCAINEERSGNGKRTKGGRGRKQERLPDNAVYTETLWEDKKLSEKADLYRYIQFMFDKSWQEVRKYAASLGISIIGDMPLYVAGDSADVWQHPELFTLKEQGAASDSKAPALVAGVPPDYFSREGQLWGNPLYRWDKMKEDGFEWWMHRFERAFSLYDVVRLDHFRGFEAYWAIPAGKKAVEGCWMPGPGRRLFEEAFRRFGPLPVIAEDLGFITPGVHSLIATTGFPGMDIMEFADRDPRTGYEPSRDRVAYTGTHDNETLLGWCMNRYKDEISAEEAEEDTGTDNGAESKKHDGEKPELTAGRGTENHGGSDSEKYTAAEVEMPVGKMPTAAAEVIDKYIRSKNETREELAVRKRKQLEEKRAVRISEELLKRFYSCGALIRIVPLQDLLGLDNSARMNIPGTVGGNWSWQAEEPIGWKKYGEKNN